MYYTVLNVDTGIGIMSKQQINYLSNSLDKNKQKHLLDLHKKLQDPYTYFTTNSKDIINSHSP
jgi:hypothetical protein